MTDSRVELRFAADGRVLVGGCRTASEPMTLQAVDAATGDVLVGDAVSHFAVCGDHVVIVPPAEPSCLVVLRAADLVRVRTVEAGGPVVGLDAAGDVVAAVTQEPNTAVVVDTATWDVRRVAVPRPPGFVRVVDGGAVVLVVTAGARSRAVVVIDATAGLVRSTVTWPYAPIQSVAKSGRWVFASTGKRILRWDLTATARAKPDTLLATTERVSLIGVSPRGLVLLDQGRAGVALDPSSGQQVWSTAHLWRAAIIGGRLTGIDCVADALHDVDPETGAARAAWRLPRRERVDVVVTSERHTAVVTGARVRPLGEPGTWPATGSGHDGTIIAVSFDGDRFATSGNDGRVIVWQRGETEPLRTIEPDSRPAKAIHLDDEQVYAGFGADVERWTVDDGQRHAVHGGNRLRGDYSVTLVLPLPGKDRLLVAVDRTPHTGSTLLLLDAVTLETVRASTIYRTVRWARWVDEHHVVLDGRTDSMGLLVDVRDLTWAVQSPDRHAATRDASVSVHGIAARASDGMIMLSNAATGAAVTSFAGPLGLHQVWWFPDGKSLLATCRNGAIHEVHPPQQ